MTAASTRPRILIQLDPDPQPSLFDAVVAVDVGVDHLLRHGAVRPEQVRDLVYGAIFTRGPSDLASTAIFVGGSDVSAGEAILDAVRSSFFDRFRVSVLFDANGANTTAAAALIAAERSLGSLANVKAAVLAGTGPVGRRVARLLARRGAIVSLGSRSLRRAEEAAESIATLTGQSIAPFTRAEEIGDTELLISAGAAGALTLTTETRRELSGLKVMIDLNAVPPAGLEGVSANAVDREIDGIKAWGALGVGGIKMKLHAQALRQLFTTNDLVLDAEEVLGLAAELA